jgi:6-pyruvoyl-tetrahydropterin synthase
MITVEKEYHFHSAHRNEEFGKDHKCSRLHGHTYYVKVLLGFKEQDSKSGITIPFEEIDAICLPVIESLDHRLLVNVNDSLYKMVMDMPKDSVIRKLLECSFREIPSVTSAENLAQYIYHECKYRFMVNTPSRNPVISVSLRETTSAWVTYSEEV